MADLSNYSTGTTVVRIATIYGKHCKQPIVPCTMDTVRWIRVSQAFSRLGYEVDIVLNCDEINVRLTPNLRYVAARSIKWDDYDVVKTFFHVGFEFLEELDGTTHPLIISKLGSVVGSHDDIDGVYFFGKHREKLFEVQTKIALRSRYVTVLTSASADLWNRSHDGSAELLLVPTGVDAELPVTDRNPYSRFGDKIAVYIGNLYNSESGQRAVNVLWQKRLTRIGALLKHRGIRLVVIGPGDTDLLDRTAVTYLGPVDNDDICGYRQFALAGLVLAQGPVQHNESSKIYEYIRSGLPVVSEVPVPNNEVIAEAQLGYVAEFNNDEDIVNCIERAVDRPWDKERAIRYMLQNHTWDQRVVQYDRLIRSSVERNSTQT